jgi:hypothetical protein
MLVNQVQSASPIDAGEMTWLLVDGKMFRELYVSPIGETAWFHCSHTKIRSLPQCKGTWIRGGNGWGEKGRDTKAGESVGMSTMQALLKSNYKVIRPDDIDEDLK